MKTVVNRHSLAAYHNKHCWRPFRGTLNDLEPKNSFFVDFSRFWAAAHIPRMNCAEITGDRPRQPAYDIKLTLSRVSWALARICCWYYGNMSKKIMHSNGINGNKCTLKTIRLHKLRAFSRFLCMVGTQLQIKMFFTAISLASFHAARVFFYCSVSTKFVIPTRQLI